MPIPTHHALAVLTHALPAAETDSVSLLEGLPIEAHLLFGGLFIGGLVLWAVGAKVLKPIFALIGVLAGAFIGFVVTALLGLGNIGGVGGWIVGMTIGGIIGLVVTLSTLKLAIVISAAATFSLVGATAGLMYVQFTGGPTETDPPKPRVAQDGTADRDDGGNLLFRDPRTDEMVSIAKLLGDDDEDETIDRVLVVAARVQAVVRSGVDFGLRQWAGLSLDQRAAVAGCTLGGVALGLVAGFFLPKRSTALITALLGSAAFLVSGVWLVDSLPWLASARPYTEQAPATWAVVWGVAATLGLAIQLSLLKKRKKNDSRD